MELTTKPVKRKDLAHFCRQLAAFVNAGLPVIDGLDLLARDVRAPKLQAVINELISDLSNGTSFFRAASGHPSVFASYQLGMLASAEMTGELDVVLDRIGDYLERDDETHNRLVSALLYPAVVFGAAIVTVIVMAVFVLPRFQTFFASLGAHLPFITQLLLDISHLVSAIWWLALPVTVIGGLFVFFGRRRPRVRACFDRVLLKLPLLRDLVRDSVCERALRTLSSMVAAGVSLPDALSVVSASTNNAVYGAGLLKVRARMLEGRGLADPIAETGLFPGSVAQFFLVGESTGTLDRQLELAAAFYSREFDFRLKRVMALFEPAVIIGVGLVVGFVAVALISAIYGVYGQVKVS
jgi:type IV pilus assembly protein PilC